MMQNSVLIFYIIKSFANAIKVNGSLKSERCEESLRAAKIPVCSDDVL